MWERVGGLKKDWREGVPLSPRPGRKAGSPREGKRKEGAVKGRRVGGITLCTDGLEDFPIAINY